MKQLHVRCKRNYIGSFCRLTILDLICSACRRCNLSRGEVWAQLVRHSESTSMHLRRCQKLKALDPVALVRNLTPFGIVAASIPVLVTRAESTPTSHHPMPGMTLWRILPQRQAKLLLPDGFGDARCAPGGLTRPGQSGDGLCWS